MIYLGKLYLPHCDVGGVVTSRGNYPKMCLFQVSESLQVITIYQ